MPTGIHLNMKIDASRQRYSSYAILNKIHSKKYSPKDKSPTVSVNANMYKFCQLYETCINNFDKSQLYQLFKNVTFISSVAKLTELEIKTALIYQ